MARRTRPRTASQIIDYTTGNRLSRVWVQHMVDYSLANASRGAFAAYLTDWAKTDFSVRAKARGLPVKVIVGEHDPALNTTVMQATFLACYPECELEVMARRRAPSDARNAGGASRPASRISAPLTLRRKARGADAEMFGATVVEGPGVGRGARCDARFDIVDVEMPAAHVAVREIGPRDRHRYRQAGAGTQRIVDHRAHRGIALAIDVIASCAGVRRRGEERGRVPREVQGDGPRETTGSRPTYDALSEARRDAAAATGRLEERREVE